MTLPAPAYAQFARIVIPVVRAVYRLDVQGLESVPRSGPLVVVANHESMLDPVALGSAIPRELRFLAKAELWRHRPLAWLLDRLGGIPVERGRGDRSAMATALAALESGSALAVFPQGFVRSAAPWQRGAAKLAIAAGAPVLPVHLHGTAKALSRGRIGFPRIRVLIGEPIAVPHGTPTIASAKQLTEDIRAAVERLASSTEGERQA